MILHKEISLYLKSSVILLLLSILFFQSFAQCETNVFFDKIIAIENDPSLTNDGKLKKVYLLKTQADNCKLPHDSVYARMLHRIGALEYVENNYNTAITNTLQSVQINMSGAKNCSKQFALRSYINLANFYKSARQIDKAIGYFDTSIQLAQVLSEDENKILPLKLDRNDLIFKKGDYQKSIEDNLLNLDAAQNADNYLYTAYFFNRLSQSYYFQNKISNAKKMADSGYLYACKSNDIYEQGTALKLKALTNAENNLFNSFLEKEVKLRIQSGILNELAGDYIDFGNVFFNHYKNYTKAKALYLKAIDYAHKENDNEKLAIANLNLGLINFYQNNYTKAQEHYLNAFRFLKLNTNIKNNYLLNASVKQLSSVLNKELMLVLLCNETELLLCRYKVSNNKGYLNASASTALLADSFITHMRHEQLIEQSKLYWRNRTHEFYNNAIQISYLLNNDSMAFYLMEKSRAVLLNDKLSEINASSLFSSADALRQKNYEIKIIELRQKLTCFDENSEQHQRLELQLINTRNESENFIKSLEQKYPAYYQYKYDDKVPELKDLQSFLAKNNQSLVHYFIGDTVTYILGITLAQTKFIRLSQKEFDKEKLSGFLQFCANKQALNNNYNAFAELSNSIYASLFKQLQLPKGRIVICMDNTIIPFEALCTDAKGKHFLLNDYSFDYTYSARFLMKKFNNPPAKGNFAGFAPVSFAKHLAVVDLKNAATALNTSASFYGNDKLFTHHNASRGNFFNYISSYSVVSIFSHAYADTTDNEPVLFMCDSLIHLSELQKLNDPATKLVLLSACQTNVGKNATGEGIYSLARGFATAGIPSVAATLWKADEQMIYAISEKLNEYLAEGMNKDEALQKAKLYFVQSSNSKKMLPYYWANMILIGNADAIQFKAQNRYNYLWWIGTAMIIIASTIMFARKRKH